MSCDGSLTYKKKKKNVKHFEVRDLASFIKDVRLFFQVDGSQTVRFMVYLSQK